MRGETLTPHEDLDVSLEATTLAPSHHCLGGQMDIDWGRLRPTAAERLRVETSLSNANRLDGTSIGFTERGHGYEACVRTARPPTTIRLHDSSLRGLAERAATLLDIVQGGG